MITSRMRQKASDQTMRYATTSNGLTESKSEK